jgi:hypothetical protein
LAAVELATVQDSKLPLEHKISKIDMICFAKPGLTEDLYRAKGRIFNNMVHVQYVHLAKGHAYS